MNTEDIVRKIEYIGLNFENIPEHIIEFKNLDFKPKNSMEGKYYKIYKYININDIKILLTPTNRLDEIETRYAKASPIYEYLDSEHQENAEKYTKFLDMLKKLNLTDIEILEEQQKQFCKKVPFEIKFKKDYLWQIYYSSNTKQYFMLATINDLENEALFYVLKKQIENKNDKVYVPICYENYSGGLLKQKELEELERELWLFTKEWPISYEVYNDGGVPEINIVGQTKIYDNIESLYKIKLSNKDEAFKIYKLLKAMFILQTELPSYYTFKIKVNDQASIEFYYDNNKITYVSLPEFIKREYIKITGNLVKIKESKINFDSTIKSLKEKSKQLDEEYISREKQISTFLECKKTFFGKVKYFLKYKKIDGVKKELKTETNEKQKQTIHYCERQNLKENYTLEELITICKELNAETASLRNIEQDIKAIENKNKIMEVKIKNSVKYIKEIDNHKKSIFEFWRFTNKDNYAMLNPGMESESNNKKINKVFNYDIDFEEYAKKEDLKNRKNLSNNEKDGIFITTTQTINDLNEILEKGKVKIDALNNIKEQAYKEEKLMDKQDFDIFGGMTEPISTNKEKNISYKKHRENSRDKYEIIKINKDTTIEEYNEKLKDILNNIVNALHNSKTEIEMPIYKVGKELDTFLNIFTINENHILKELYRIEDNEVNLFKIILPDGSNAIALSNIIYYDNVNQTLPVGMDEGDKILINLNDVKINLINSETNYIAFKKEEMDVEIKKINIFEYKI